MTNIHHKEKNRTHAFALQFRFGFAFLVLSSGSKPSETFPLTHGGVFKADIQYHNPQKNLHEGNNSLIPRYIFQVQKSKFSVVQ